MWLLLNLTWRVVVHFFINYCNELIIIGSILYISNTLIIIIIIIIIIVLEWTWKNIEMAAENSMYV